MYKKITICFLVMLSVCACQKHKQDIDGEVNMTDSMCEPVMRPLEYIPQAEKGDRQAIYKAILYYGDCADLSVRPDSHTKEMYWEKKLADTGDLQYLNFVAGTIYNQLDPRNNSKDFSLPTDPLLYWAWSKKICDRVKVPSASDLESFGKAEILAMQAECNPVIGPDFIPKEQWQKIITSPPTVKDKRWMQYLPKGCEQGQCLPK